MSTPVAAAVDLGLYLTGLIAAFGVRSVIHRGRTGRSGFLGLTGTAGSLEWFGGILFAAALILAAAGPALTLVGIQDAVALPQALTWVGLVLAAVGFWPPWPLRPAWAPPGASASTPAYTSYAAKVGRFLPRIGRLRTDTLDLRPARATREGSAKER